jgi:hypothetical protein
MVLGQCVTPGAGCNWYLYDINIYFLSKSFLRRTGPLHWASFIRSMIKLFMKVHAHGPAPNLESRVSCCQSAFIKRRCIQENFLYVQNKIKFFHKTTKNPSILLKLDPTKHLIRFLGHIYLTCFERMDWINMILACSSSQVLTTGTVKVSGRPPCRRHS